MEGKELFDIVYPAASIFMILASIFNWDWVFKFSNIRFTDRTFGRSVARVILFLMGLLFLYAYITFFNW